MEDNQEPEEEFESPYCPICSSCGEDGCCPATMCVHDPNGKYCDWYLRDLRFGYVMFEKIYGLVHDDPKYKDEIDKMYDKYWDLIFEHE